MSATFPRCGHARTPENTDSSNGPIVQCRACYDARIAGVREETHQRNQLMRAAFRDGMTVETLAARYGFTRDTIKRILRDGDPDKKASRDPLFFGRALVVAAELAGANVKQLCSEWRAPKELVHARWAVMSEFRRRGLSTPAIGKRLNRDHSTVIYGLKQAGYLAERSPEFVQMLAAVEAA